MIRKDWVNPDKRRFYRATLFHDLLGQCILFRVWGCMDSHQSCSLHRLMDSYEQGLSLIQELHYRRTRDGYQVSGVEKKTKPKPAHIPGLQTWEQMPLSGLSANQSHHNVFILL